MACCSSAPRAESRKARQSLSQSVKSELGEAEEYVRESRVAERVTELISPAWPPRTRGAAGGHGWDQHLPVVIVPGMCSSGLKVLKSADQPSWENDRIWLSMQKLSANQVVGGRVGTMEQTHGATITVVIERAQHLAACDGNGTSDPFVKVALLTAEGALASRMWQTSVKTKTLSPEWEEDFLLGTRSDVDKASICLVEVMDKDIAGADDHLGQLEFSIASIKAGDYAEPAWHALGQRHGSDIDAQGSLRLSIRYDPAPTTTAEPPKEPAAPEVDDVFSKLSYQEAVEACDELGIAVTEGETTLLNLQAAIRAHFVDTAARNPRAVFAKIDTDGSGTLDQQEVERAAAMLGFLFNREQAAEAFQEMDANNDNEISVSEFESWWARQLQKMEAQAVGATGGEENQPLAPACPWAKRVAIARKKLLGSSAWVRHMCLAEDGQSDPIGIQVRALRGLPGVAYLQAGAMSPFTWVFAKVIDHLKANGYEANKNLLACPYDWRLALRWQEQRDGYFSKLKQTIENAKATNNGKPVVLLAHSMGNRTVHYFLNWVRNTQDDGQRWLDEHVHSFFATAAPFLGASSAFRGAMLGEDFGIGAFINQDLATILCRSCSAGPEVFPVGPLAAGDIAYLRHEGRLTIDVLSAELTAAAGSPLSMQVDVQHSRLKHRKRHSRSLKTRNSFVDGSKGDHGSVEYYQRFQFITEHADINHADGEELTFNLRMDKSPIGMFSLALSDWFVESKTGTLHLSGLAEQSANYTEAHVTELFQRYGPVSAVTIRQKLGKANSSWALITFEESTTADQALSDAESLRAEGVIVARFDLTRRANSTGNLGPVLQEHRAKLQGPRGLTRTDSSGQPRRSERRRRDSRVMLGPHHPGQPSDELYDLDLDNLKEVFKSMATKSWSRDRWENLQLKPFCFSGHDALEWLKRWLFENDLPHAHADALHVGTRLMNDKVFEAIPSASAHGSTGKDVPLCHENLYQLTELASNISTELVPKEGLGRMTLTLGTPHETITPDKRVYVVGACGVIRRMKIGEQMCFDTSATPGGDIVVSRQESNGGLERTSGYGEIALRPNHGKERWAAETEMSLTPRSSHHRSQEESDIITVALEWELVHAASDGETVVEDISHFNETNGAWMCMDEIEPSASHPKLHPDDDSLDATSEENKIVAYRTVRLEDSSGICMAELHVVLTFEGTPIAGPQPKKLDEHCPYEYQPRELHEMLTRHGAGNCVDIHQSSRYDPNGLLHGTQFKAPPCRRVFHAYGINLDTEVGYFFKNKNGVELMPSGPKSSCGVELDGTASMSNLNFKVRSGVIFETGTTQHTIDETEIRASGDGTVPYTSLRYSEQWNSPTCRSEIVEIDKSEHREILADSRFHAVLLEYLSETLVCYVLEATGLALPKGGSPSSFVLGTLCYADGQCSKPQKTQTFQRQPHPRYEEVMCFGAGKAHLGGCAGSRSGESEVNEGDRGARHGRSPTRPGGTVVDDTADRNSGSNPAVGVQFQVFSSRKKPLADVLLGTVNVELEDILASPTRAVQAWYTLMEPNERGASAMKLRLHLELEEPGQSYRGRGGQQAIAAVLAQDPFRLESLP